MVPKQSRLLVMNIVRGSSLHIPTIRLAKAAPIPAADDVVLADLTECDFDGYSVQNPSWGAPSLDGAFIGSMNSGLLSWTAGALLAAPQTIFAIYITYPDPTDFSIEKLLDWQAISPTVTLANPGEVFQRTYILRDTNF